MRALDTVTARLSEVTGYQALRLGAGWQCPAHDDRSPSLSVSNGNGRVLLRCHAGCSVEAILEALKLEKADLFDEPIQRADRAQVVDRYDYVDEAGDLLFQVVREELGNAKKIFPQRRPDGAGGWIDNLTGTRRVLYRLPRVRDAIAGGWSIFIAEGEKDVHALEAAGEVATCNPMGAGSWKPEYTEMLAGAAEVIIVADKDEQGRNHARDIERGPERRYGWHEHDERQRRRHNQPGGDRGRGTDDSLRAAAMTRKTRRSTLRPGSRRRGRLTRP